MAQEALAKSSKKVVIIEFEKNGAIYCCADYQEPATATICLGSKRVVMKGLLSIKTVTKRYKFPDEMVFTMRASKADPFKTETRNPSSVNTVEMYMSLEDAEELLLQALEIVRKKKGE